MMRIGPDRIQSTTWSTNIVLSDDGLHMSWLLGFDDDSSCNSRRHARQVLAAYLAQWSLQEVGYSSRSKCVSDTLNIVPETFYGNDKSFHQWRISCINTWCCRYNDVFSAGEPTSRRVILLMKQRRSSWHWRDTFPRLVPWYIDRYYRQSRMKRLLLLRLHRSSIGTSLHQVAHCDFDLNNGISSLGSHYVWDIDVNEMNMSLLSVMLLLLQPYQHSYYWYR